MHMFNDRYQDVRYLHPPDSALKHPLAGQAYSHARARTRAPMRPVARRAHCNRVTTRTRHTHSCRRGERGGGHLPSQGLTEGRCDAAWHDAACLPSPSTAPANQAKPGGSVPFQAPAPSPLPLRHASQALQGLHPLACLGSRRACLGIILHGDDDDDDDGPQGVAGTGRARGMRLRLCATHRAQQSLCSGRQDAAVASSCGCVHVHLAGDGGRPSRGS